MIVIYQYPSHVHYMYFMSFVGKSIKRVHMYIAVGEKGVNPVIVIYQYPSLSLYRILREGLEHHHYTSHSLQQVTIIFKILHNVF